MASLFEQDIALLHLEESLVYSPSLLPVCLPPPDDSKSYQVHISRYFWGGAADKPTGTVELQGVMATLTGWGRQWDEGPLAEQLEVVELPVISNRECMDWYSRSALARTAPQSCLLCLGTEQAWTRSGSRQLIPEETFLCAGFRQGRGKEYACHFSLYREDRRDACTGDSGGPLVVYRPEDGRAQLLGVVS